jgi:Methyltransferase domain
MRGIGLSDEPLYADVLATKLSYVNTYLHQEPRFDLTDPACGESGSLDFILATEVFEHIPPPVQPAFDNLARLLKPGGFVVFSTPWRPQGRTVEHFPNLYRWTVTQLDERYVLVNKTRSNRLEVFDELAFHGGMGHTLEMRLFSQPGLIQNFRRAGLEPEWALEPYPDYGVQFSKPWSIPCVARKLATAIQLLEDVEPDPCCSPESVEQDRSEVAELYREIDRQTAHAYTLTSQISQLQKQLQSTQRELQNQQSYVASLERERALIKDSRWLRLGRRLNVGPKVD